MAQKIAEEKIFIYLEKNNEVLGMSGVEIKRIEDILIGLKFPNRSWFRRFIKKYEIMLVRQVGDAATVNLDEHKARIKELSKILQEYNEHDVYNFDETSLFYNEWNSPILHCQQLYCCKEKV